MGQTLQTAVTRIMLRQRDLSINAEASSSQITSFLRQHTVKAAFFQVGIGKYSVLDTSSNYESIRVLKQIPHPKYTGQPDHENDFMIVVLSKSASTPPVCLADDSTELNIGDDMAVIGFGKVENERSPLNLQETDVQYITNDDCFMRYSKKYLISDNMMCATSEVGKDACKGDSGGPLIKLGRNSAEDVALGVISWGLGCGTYPGVYSRIAAQRDWIISMVRANSGIMCGENSLRIRPIPLESERECEDDKYYRYYLNNPYSTCAEMIALNTILCSGFDDLGNRVRNMCKKSCASCYDDEEVIQTLGDLSMNTTIPTKFPIYQLVASSPSEFSTDEPLTFNPTEFPSEQSVTFNPTEFPINQHVTSNPMKVPADQPLTSSPTKLPTKPTNFTDRHISPIFFLNRQPQNSNSISHPSIPPTASPIVKLWGEPNISNSFKHTTNAPLSISISNPTSNLTGTLGPSNGANISTSVPKKISLDVGKSPSIVSNSSKYPISLLTSIPVTNPTNFPTISNASSNSTNGTVASYSVKKIMAEEVRVILQIHLVLPMALIFLLLFLQRFLWKLVNHLRSFLIRQSIH
eukprot:CAMPEP_0194269452 /NCGR_PEP_ID=MMETSP0169-20130528/3604_1 /TAXON_ID=218684 /ORGANISM="Corethron pennatum, Strain L29A3" /LENGTH=578 /DNA_ID=CAMNT_0039011095 /DNA_START=323 /DNA_END=2058 /DNA_ORIENTATION=-